MPAPLLAAGIAAGSQLASTAIGAAATGKQNRKSRAFSREMYDRQRRDSLADWAMQNEYNSPLAQMQRLRAAGLNPNLVYENGATHSAQPIRSSEAPSWRPVAADYSGIGNAAGAGIEAYYSVQEKQAQIDNLKTQNTVMFQDALLKAAQIVATNASTGKTKADTETSQYNLEYQKSIRDISVDALRASLEKTKADTTYTLDQNERAAAMQATNLQMAIENILTARANRETNKVERARLLEAINGLKKDNELKQLDINLRKIGINPSDPTYQRIIGQIISKVDPKGFIQSEKIKTTSNAARLFLNPGTNGVYQLFKH